ncbi:hypothetical protein K7472_04040 [Streptomyces sp. PTM05]|uniref:Uncharacterized protein n=1 Tax=Streptantibioticus parmotrematis TaxID=2873249 RepID=A0ABS7QM50_9ACTN|nr:hypothetical protein [Streptantibioticus parmotrematis]MBY8884013.1 hypothetical protein [Streptantibioticus parmotrematis]
MEVIAIPGSLISPTVAELESELIIPVELPEEEELEALYAPCGCGVEACHGGCEHCG